MSVHEQLISRGHEEPIRAKVSDPRVWASRRRRRTASWHDADTDRAPGWPTQALQFSALARNTIVSTGAPDAFASPPTSASSAPEWQLCRELHDGLGPTLAGLALGLGTAEALAAGQPNLHALLGRLTAEAERAVADLRRTVYGLRSRALDELGLAGALRDQAERLRCQVPTLAISLDVPIKGLAGLAPAVEMACYRIVTEALANIVRHADATRCAVRFRLGRGIRMDVRDNGSGLPTDWRAGVGIVSMREHARELGGELLIGPNRPHGTRVAARLPLQEQP
jgi:two-component system, NarL family, sensor kinase